MRSTNASVSPDYRVYGRQSPACLVRTSDTGAWRPPGALPLVARSAVQPRIELGGGQVLQAYVRPPLVVVSILPIVDRVSERTEATRRHLATLHRTSKSGRAIPAASSAIDGGAPLRSPDPAGSRSLLQFRPPYARASFTAIIWSGVQALMECLALRSLWMYSNDCRRPTLE